MLHFFLARRGYDAIITMIACHLDALEPFWLKCARSEATVMQLVHDQFPPPPPEPARTWNAYDEMVKWEAETGYTGDNLYLDWVKSWLLPEQEEAEQSDIPPAPPAPPPHSRRPSS